MAENIAMSMMPRLQCSSQNSGRTYAPSHAKTVKFSMDVEVFDVPHQCDGRMGTWIQDNMREERERRLQGLMPEPCDEDDELDSVPSGMPCVPTRGCEAPKNRHHGNNTRRGESQRNNMDGTDTGSDEDDDEDDDEDNDNRGDWLVVEFDDSVDIERPISTRRVSVAFSHSGVDDTESSDCETGEDSDGEEDWDEGDDDEEEEEEEDDDGSVAFGQCASNCAGACCRSDDRRTWFPRGLRV